MAQFQRHFSVAEARSLLPEIRMRFAAIHELIRRVRSDQQRSDEQRLRISRGNGKGPILQGVSPLIAEVQSHIDALVKSGIEIKNLETGLIDFPHYLSGDDNHEVFLCYEISEADIGFWHEIEDGYAGRRAL